VKEKKRNINVCGGEIRFACGATASPETQGSFRFGDLYIQTFQAVTGFGLDFCGTT